MPQAYSPWLDPRMQPQIDPEMTQEEALMTQGLAPNGVPQGIPIGQEAPDQLAINPADKTDQQRALAAAIQQANQKQQELVAQQQLGVDQLQQYANQMAKMPTQPDLSGIAALADAWGPDKSNFAAVYKRPPTEQERAAQLFELQNKLQERKADLTKSQYQNLLANIQAMKAQKDNALADELTKAKIGFYGSNNRQALLESQQAAQAHQQILNKLSTNKAAQQKLQQIQGIDNAGKIIEDAPQVTPQIFDDYQQALVSAISRGNSGIGERAKRYMESAGISAASIQQFLTGKPVSIPGGNQNAFYKVMQEFARTERKNIQKQYNQIVDSVSSGQERIYKKHPEMKKDLEKAVQSYKGMAEETPIHGTPKPGDVVDGHVFKGGDPADPNSWEAQ